MNTGAAALLASCDFPARWAGMQRCVLLQTHFGDGEGVLASWHAWRGGGLSAPAQSAQAAQGAQAAQAAQAALGAHAAHAAQVGQAAAGQLLIVSIVAQPALADQAQALPAAHRHAPWAPLAERLRALWPVETPDLHVLDLEPGVRLLLAMGARPWLRLLRLQADLVLFDAARPPPGASSVLPTAGASAWDAHALQALARLAAPHAVWLGADGAATALGAARGGARRLQQPVARGQDRPATAPMRAVVVGAGIAGACTARALAAAGWDCTVLDAAHAPAQGASGNAAGLFHGTVHVGDGLHARFTRACALRAARFYSAMLQAGVPGNADGMLRAHAEQQAGMADGRPWPLAWVQRLDAAGAQALAPGLRAHSAWFFPGGGWVAAGEAVRWLLQAPGIRFQGGARVHTLRRRGADWTLLDAAGQTLARAHAVVLASAGQWPLVHCDAASGPALAPGLPEARFSRGQTTWFDSPGRLRHPVAGHGYALTGPGGQLLCGASSAPDVQPGRDTVPSDSDHRFNLQRLLALTGLAPAPGATLHGRVGWRHLTVDRLPLVGAVPCAVGVQPQRLERLRDVARAPNLWMLAGLGGRGFTWAPLLGDVVAALVSADPVPMEAALLDAVDPARHLLRQSRRAAQELPSGPSGHPQE